MPYSSLVRWLLPSFLALLSTWTGGSHPRSAPEAAIQFNDNRRAAGTLVHGVLTVALEARAGEWKPLGADQRGVRIFAFGEAGKPLQDPGPLLRVRVGTEIRASVTNRTDTVLVVHGLSRRRVSAMDTLVVRPGATEDVRFVADAEGTYYYWASAHGEGFEDRQYDDAHLNGALIVDPDGAEPKPDRVFVVERLIPAGDTSDDAITAFELFTINGRAWPNTERLTYDVGDSVRWRVINASNDVHPFHLHGFYYRVDARGDLQQDTIYWPSQRRMDVTEPVWDGTTMDLVWSPDRPGGWIFHCHLNWHVLPNPVFPLDTEQLGQRTGHVLNGYPDVPMEDHARYGMGGLVLGINVRAPAGSRPYAGARRTLRLLVESDSAPGDSTRRFGYVLEEDGRARDGDSIRVPGPAIVLRRGEPTRIWVVNRTAEMTQVHWHGLEIESYYDGVAGVSGTAGAMEPPIMPGDSFEVRVTPPRAGSFMYHTHINDIRQQSHGLYGPLIVVDSGAAWNPDTDRVFMTGDGPDYGPELNGTRAPAPLTLKSGVPYRFRLMNVTMGGPGLVFALVRNGAALEWTPLGKDGFAVPVWQGAPRKAAQVVSIGETYDFKVQAPDSASVALELRTGGGSLVASQPIRFVKEGRGGR
jgi:FtsP/CotA-like multicopper oxidase with cupredoxin domain